MDEEMKVTAADIVNNYSEHELINIFYKYGEEPFSKEIARKICKVRETSPITTTFQLVDIIKSSVPAKILRKPTHPAKQVFQALRIEVNHELDYLEKSLEGALKTLKKENGVWEMYGRKKENLDDAVSSIVFFLYYRKINWQE